MTKLHIPEGYIKRMQGNEVQLSEEGCLASLLGGLSTREIGCYDLYCDQCFLNLDREWESVEEVREVEIEVYIQPEESE